MKTWSEQVAPLATRLEVYGKFGGGIALDAKSATEIGKMLKVWADMADLEACRSAQRRHALVVGWELTKCLAVVALFGLGGIWFNG